MRLIHYSLNTDVVTTLHKNKLSDFIRILKSSGCRELFDKVRVVKVFPSLNSFIREKVHYCKNHSMLPPQVQTYFHSSERYRYFPRIVHSYSAYAQQLLTYDSETVVLLPRVQTQYLNKNIEQIKWAFLIGT